MNQKAIKAIVLLLLAAVMVSAFSAVAAADEGITVSEPAGGTESAESATPDIIIEQHAMKKYEWAYYIIAFISVSAVIAAAVVISKRNAN